MRGALVVFVVLLSACGGGANDVEQESVPIPNDSANRFTGFAPQLDTEPLTDTRTVDERGEVELQATATDEDSEELRYVWLQQSGPTIPDSEIEREENGRIIRFTAPPLADPAQPETLRFRIYVYDESNNSDFFDTTVDVAPADRLADLTFTDPALQACVDRQAAANEWRFVSEVQELDCSLGSSPVCAVDDCTIRDLASIEQLSQLTLLDVSGHEVASLEPLLALTELAQLEMLDHPPVDTSALVAANPSLVIDQSPAMTTPVGLSVVERQSVQFQIDFSDPDGGPVTFQAGLQSGPSATIVSNPSGKVTVVAPSVTEDAVVTLRLSIRDDEGNSLIDTLAIDILANQHLEDVVFNDANLRACALENAEDRDVVEAVQLETLQCGSRDISDLGGIEALENLGTLNLSDNPVTDLIPLMSLNRLETLNLDDCTGVNDLNPLAGLADLFHLEMEGVPVDTVAGWSELNQITDLFITGQSGDDLNVLAGMSALGNIRINTSDTEDDSLPDITPLTALPALYSLYLNGELADFSPLSSLATQLTILKLENQSGVDMSVIGDLTELKTLYLNTSGISDLSELTTLLNLESLQLRGNFLISDLTPLTGLTGLTRLDLFFNSVENLTPLQNLTNLNYLNLRNNQLTDLTALQNLTNLKTLYLSGNSSLDESDYAVLSDLELENKDF